MFAPTYFAPTYFPMTYYPGPGVTSTPVTALGGGGFGGLYFGQGYFGQATTDGTLPIYTLPTLIRTIARLLNGRRQSKASAGLNRSTKRIN